MSKGLPPDELADLKVRLIRSMDMLREMADAEFEPTASQRLNGKVEGVALALDYLRSYE